MKIKERSKLLITTVFSLFLAFNVNPEIPWSRNFLPIAEAGFFNNDLDTFQSVLLLVSKNYVYPPDYQKLFTSALKNIALKTNHRDASVEISANGKISAIIEDKKFQYKFGHNMDGNFQSFKKIFYLLVHKSGGSPSKKSLEATGIAGMMDALDPYSQYLDETLFERSMRDTEGQYGGLGMVITMEDYQLTVIKTMKNSPARRAGILPNDIIVNVSGKPIKGMQIDQLASLMRGYPNTKVSLTVFRPDTGKHKIYTLNREIISVETVEYKKMGDETGYIKISSFSKQTNEQLEEALKKARKENVLGFILDLRNNPGGLLDQSVKVASHFLKHGSMVVFTQGRERKNRDEYRALYKSSLKSVPIAILINHQSASASEIVAGALRDSGRALIIGENSYGKGSVQTIFKIGENEGIRLTTSKYYTPSGIDITKQGIVPEVQILNDIISEEKIDFSNNKNLAQNQIEREKPSIQLKQSEVEKFLSKNGITITKKNDPTLLLSHMIVKHSIGIENKKLAMEKVREFTANIHY